MEVPYELIHPHLSLPSAQQDPHRGVGSHFLTSGLSGMQWTQGDNICRCPSQKDVIIGQMAEIHAH